MKVSSSIPVDSFNQSKAMVAQSLDTKNNVYRIHDQMPNSVLSGIGQNQKNSSMMNKSSNLQRRQRPSTAVVTHQRDVQRNQNNAQNK